MTEAAQERMTGVVIAVIEKGNFAFIRTPGHKDHFFHLDDVAEGQEIGRHSAVSFIHKEEPLEKRDRALDVRLASRMAA